MADDGNSIGPIAAACLGTAEIYMRLYSAQIERDTSFAFSAFDYSEDPRSNPSLPTGIRLPRTFVPGAGAIGMGFLLTLECMVAISGSDGLLVIDDDKLDATNLNRCLLAVLADIGHSKLEVVGQRLANRALDF